jgi:glycerol-3-phosphate dehydrogenase (NAD(P)+)
MSPTVAVLGAGSWGTTLAVHLAKLQHPVAMWDHDTALIDAIASDRENRKFLSGIPLPDGIKVHRQVEEALRGADVILFVVPSHALREVAGRVRSAGGNGIPVCATKGLELGTLKRPGEMLEEALGDPDPVVFVGPSHAEEVSRDIPTSIVAASRNAGRAADVQRLFSNPRLRVYTNEDVAGCEYGAALKNVIAIAAGICDGLDLGDNAKAALVTRGMVEIARFGRSRGASSKTFFGLAGIGDLVTTCFSRHSRNRAVGEAIGRGEKLEHILSGMRMVAEGVWTAKALFGPEADLGETQMPIAEQVHAVLFDGKDPREAVTDLMNRAPTAEMDSLMEEFG